MNNHMELKWNELKISYQPSDFSFITTTELEGSNGIIGQESALETFALGLKMNTQGYNIYICSESGVGKEYVIKALLEEKARTMATPKDICYIYNFRAPETPQSIVLQPSEGKRFKDDMDEFVQFIINDLPLELESLEARRKKQVIIDKLESMKEKWLMELSEKSEAVGILVKVAEEGIGFAPLGLSGEIISKEEYSHLNTKQKEQLKAKLEGLYVLADHISECMNEEEKSHLQSLKDINEEIILESIGGLIKYLQEKYAHYPCIGKYLNDIAEDLLNHIDLLDEENEENTQNIKELLPWMSTNKMQRIAKRYTVNLLVSHEVGAGAPVITDSGFKELRLSGKILLDTEFNMMHSDFTHIRPGLFHEANGGYIILNMQTLLENPNAWLQVKRMLKTGYIPIESAEDMNIALATSIKPEPVEAQIKVILLGNSVLYEALYQYDEDLKKLFKIKVEFDDEIESNKGHIQKLAEHIKNLCDKEKLPPVTLKAILRLVEYGNRLTETPRKLPANIEGLLDLVREASIYAEESIDEACISKAIHQRQLFNRKLEQKIDEHIMEHTYLIDTEGERIGQVNGLAIYTLENYMFGRPVKITATTYKGKQGIVDIEKQADLSGAIHTKGIHIITGFLGHQFAQNRPLSLSCNICFEQSYAQIDGDSAASAELYAILSSLSEIPIKQNIGTTGSVNQFGEIQPIGGVNEKIEGFFKICKKRKLNGHQGVIIPWQNKKELMLGEEITEAVKNNLFHIYTIKTIWEGLEIITGKNVAEIIPKVEQKLELFNK